MRAKKKILFYSALEIKYIISFSLSLCASLSLSLSHSALILSQDSLKLSSSLNYSPLSPSLSQSPSFTAAGLTQPSQAPNRHTVTLLSHRHSLKLLHSPPLARPSRPKPLIASDPHRWPTLFADPVCRRCACLWLVIFYFVCDWWFCLFWVKVKNWRVFFFFLLVAYCGLLVLVVVVGGYGWW